MRGSGRLVLVQAGDLILRDFQTVHGGIIATGDIKTEDTTKTQLACLSVPMCMAPHLWLGEEFL